MSSSRDNPPTIEEQDVRFRILDVLYANSDAYKYVNIPYEDLYRELQANDENEQNIIYENFVSLSEDGLADSKAMGCASITQEGIKEFENAILGYPENVTQFPLNTIGSVYSESKKNKIITILNQRGKVLLEVYKKSRGSTMQTVNSTEILKSLGYEWETFKKILEYLVDEGFVESLAAGGGLLKITRLGIEQVK